MNIADIYAIGCLLVWCVSLGLGILMLCRGRLPEAERKCKFPFAVIVISMLVSIFISMILLAGNPVYLSWMLLAIILLLAVCGLITGRYRMQELTTVFALLGTMGVYFVFGIAGDNGFEAGHSRLKARRILAVSALKHAAENDKNIYPAGEFNQEHPAVMANPDLRAIWISGFPRPIWHTFFTNLYAMQSFPPVQFRAGTIADNQETLQEHIYQVKP